MLAIAAMALTFTSCKKEDVEAKAKDYSAKIVEALMNQDDAKGDSLAKACEEWVNGLKGEDKAKAEEIIKKAQEEAMAQLQAANAAIDEAQEAIDEAEAAEALEGALEEAVDAAIEEAIEE